MEEASDARALQPSSNNKSRDLSPAQLGQEISALFAENPDSNPFQIMADRNKFDYTENVYQRKAMVDKLQNETNREDEPYI